MKLSILRKIIKEEVEKMLKESVTLGGLTADEFKFYEERAKKMSKNGLEYSIKDCQAAIKANMNPDRYYDQISVFRSELNRRNGKVETIKEYEHFEDENGDVWDDEGNQVKKGTGRNTGGPRTYSPSKEKERIAWEKKDRENRKHGYTTELNEPTGMSLDVAKQRGKDIHGRQYNDLTTVGDKTVTKQNKSVNNFEKNIQPELKRVVTALKFYLKYINPNSEDYKTAENIINTALITGKIPTNAQQGLISQLAGKYGLKETNA